MKKRILIALLIAVTAAGCSKSDTLLDSSAPSYEPSESQIQFSTPDNWGDDELTRGYVTDDDTYYTLNSMELYAYYTAQKEWGGVVSPDDFASFMYDQSITREYTNKSWSTWQYSPAKYWPNNSDDKITFFAFAPENMVTIATDQVTGKPIFSYTSHNQSEYNQDLVACVNYDETKSNSAIVLNFKHALTRIKFSVKILNAETTAEGETDIYYTVNGVMFDDVMSQSELSFDTNGDIVWSTPTEPLCISTTQGHTLRDKTDIAARLVNDKYIDVCKDGHGVFVLPQPIEAAEGNVPMVELRIRKHYTYKNQDGEDTAGELIYAPAAVAIPTPKKEGWKMGQYIDMQFTFDVNAGNSTPLTVKSEIYNYSDVDLDIDINRNIYIYSDKNGTIDVASSEMTADIGFYTNYDSGLRVKSALKQLDGSLIVADGFTFCPDGSDTYIEPILIDQSDDAQEYIYSYNLTNGALQVNGVDVPYIDGVPDMSAYAFSAEYNGKTYADWLRFKIKFDDNNYFTYSALKATRAELGLSSSSADGINAKDTDDVYILRIDINDDHLSLYEDDGASAANKEEADYGLFKGKIGVEMLSSAGGMITKVFPITLKKSLN